MRRDISLSEYAIVIGMSETRLSDALQGLYDWKFTELARVAEKLGYTLPQLMTPPGVAIHG